jgi:fatty acid desaturase
MGPALRAILGANQTLVGRVLIGPPLRLVRLAQREAARIAAGDFSNAPHWIVHAALVAALFVYISGIAGMPWWQYLLLVAWPAFALGWVRSFAEHSFGPPVGVGRNASGTRPLADARPGERTAITEAGWFWSLLFLNNNLHAVHHLYPKMPWFEVPGAYRANRERVLAHNGGYRFASYAEIARRWLLRPVFAPPHPRW